MVAGGGGALAWRWHGDRRRKSLAQGGLEGWPGRRRTGSGEWFRGGQGGEGARERRRPRVEVEDEPQALDFVSNCWKID